MYLIVKNVHGSPVGASLEVAAWKDVIAAVTESPINLPGKPIVYSNQWSVDGGSRIYRDDCVKSLCTTFQIYHFLTDLASEYGEVVYDFRGTAPTLANFKRFLDVSVTERERELIFERMS